jgi:ATP-dependent DNA helicase DinG
MSKRPPIRDYFPVSPEISKVRPSQDKAIDAIERACDAGKKFVLLELPTGTGKSAIGIAVSRWAGSWGNGAYILSPQKMLTTQYMRDFSRQGLVELLGRANYHCQEFATDCEVGGAIRSKTETVCIGCPYKIRKDEFVSEKMGVTNFDYFLSETLYSGQLPKRSLLVIDEAHNLDQKILQFTDFEISPIFLQKYSIPIPEIADGDIGGACEWIQHDVIPAVDDFISNLAEEAEERTDDMREAENLLRRMRGFLSNDGEGWAFWNDQNKLIFRPLSSAKYAPPIAVFPC